MGCFSSKHQESAISERPSTRLISHDGAVDSTRPRSALADVDGPLGGASAHGRAASGQALAASAAALAAGKQEPARTSRNSRGHVGSLFELRRPAGDVVTLVTPPDCGPLPTSLRPGAAGHSNASLGVIAAGASHVGGRTTQEDRHFVATAACGDPRFVVAAVLDGHGGPHAAAYLARVLHIRLLAAITAERRYARRAATLVLEKGSIMDVGASAAADPFSPAKPQPQPQLQPAASATTSSGNNSSTTIGRQCAYAPGEPDFRRLFTYVFQSVDSELLALQKHALSRANGGANNNANTTTAVAAAGSTTTGATAGATAAATGGDEGLDYKAMPHTSGACAVVAVLYGDALIVANAGDCEAWLCRGGRPYELTVPHKASRPSELARIRRTGGAVAALQGQMRVGGALLVSRGLGQYQLKREYTGLIAQPHVTVAQLALRQGYTLPPPPSHASLVLSRVSSVYQTPPDHLLGLGPPRPPPPPPPPSATTALPPLHPATATAALISACPDPVATDPALALVLRGDVLRGDALAPQAQQPHTAARPVIGTVPTDSPPLSLLALYEEGSPQVGSSATPATPATAAAGGGGGGAGGGAGAGAGGAGRAFGFQPSPSASSTTASISTAASASTVIAAAAAATVPAPVSALPPLFAAANAHHHHQHSPLHPLHLLPLHHHHQQHQQQEQLLHSEHVVVDSDVDDDGEDSEKEGAVETGAKQLQALHLPLHMRQQPVPHKQQQHPQVLLHHHDAGADEFLVLGSDGLFDVFPNRQDLMNRVKAHLRACHGDVSAAAHALVSEAAVQRRAADNVTLVLLVFNAGGVTTATAGAGGGVAGYASRAAATPLVTARAFPRTSHNHSNNHSHDHGEQHATTAAAAAAAAVDVARTPSSSMPAAAAAAGPVRLTRSHSLGGDSSGAATAAAATAAAAAATGGGSKEDQEGEQAAAAAAAVAQQVLPLEDPAQLTYRAPSRAASGMGAGGGGGHGGGHGSGSGSGSGSGGLTIRRPSLRHLSEFHATSKRGLTAAVAAAADAHAGAATATPAPAAAAAAASAGAATGTGAGGGARTPAASATAASAPSTAAAAAAAPAATAAAPAMRPAPSSSSRHLVGLSWTTDAIPLGTPRASLQQ